MAKEAPKTDLQFLEQFEPDQFWEQHSTKIMGGVLVVVLIGLGVYLWQHHRTEQVRLAAARLAVAADVAAYQAIIQDFEGQEAAGQARLRLADLHFRDGQYADAEIQYRAFLEKFPTHPLVPSAHLGLAAIHEANGQLEVAKADYQRLAASLPQAYTAGSAKLGAARCAEALGQLPEARQLYNETMAVARGTPLEGVAFLRWGILGREVAEPVDEALPPTGTNAVGTLLPPPAPAGP